MSNIIQIKDHLPPKGNPSFTVSAEHRDGAWYVNVEDFHDKGMSVADMYREIAEALPPLACGLIKSAEMANPTKRGFLFASISLFVDGTIQLHSRPLNSPKRKAWFMNALDKVKEHAMPKKRVRKG